MPDRVAAEVENTTPTAEELKMRMRKYDACEEYHQTLAHYFELSLVMLFSTELAMN